MTRILTTLIVLASLLSAQYASAQVIRVNKEATLETHQDVRLGDIATVNGADPKTADTLANLVIIPDAKESRTLRAEAVLMAVLAQIGPGKLADKLEIGGAATCEIRIVDKPAKTETPVAPAASTAAAAQLQTTTTQTAATKPDAGPSSKNALSQLIVEELQRNLVAGQDDLRISFTTSNPLLDSPTPEGKRWIIRPLNRSFLGTVQFEAQLADATRILQKFNVQAQVLKRQRVLVVAAALSRGDIVTNSHIRAQETWLDRQLPTLLLQEKDAIGLEALRPVGVGAILDQRDFRAVEMAGRGESLSVVFIQGNLKIQMKAVAMQGGKLHDSIQVKNDANETYQATLIGKRLAVVGQLNDKLEQELREAR